MTTLATQFRQTQTTQFALSSAVRPCGPVPMEPVEGYRIERFRDRVSRKRIPLLAASISADRLFEIFLDLLEPLGDTVDVVLETSHAFRDDRHEDLGRSEIDLPVLASHLCDFEDLLVNDGCTGVAVLANDRAIEVQLDEHKLIYVYANDLKPFRRILRQRNVLRRDTMRLIAEAEHVHHSGPAYAQAFQQLCCSIAAGEVNSVATDENEWLEGC